MENKNKTRSYRWLSLALALLMLLSILLVNGICYLDNTLLATAANSTDGITELYALDGATTDTVSSDTVAMEPSSSKVQRLNVDVVDSDDVTDFGESSAIVLMSNSIADDYYFINNVSVEGNVLSFTAGGSGVSSFSSLLQQMYYGSTSLSLEFVSETTSQTATFSYNDTSVYRELSGDTSDTSTILSIDMYYLLADNGYNIFCNDWEVTMTISNANNTDIVSFDYNSNPLPDAPAKTGYTFAGWYTNEDCTELYDDPYLTGELNLYAGFTANTYSIVFNSTGGTGTMSSQAMTYDTSSVLSANSFSKTGYTFQGWSDTAGGDVVYADGASVSNLTSTADGEVELYAVWGLNSYTITWIVDGTSSTTSVAYGTVPTFSGSTAKSATAQYTYTFDGWDTTPVAVTGTATYTAEYSSVVNSYTITWIVDGTTTTTSVAYGTVPTFAGSTAKSATAQYTYTFDGWDNDPVAVTGNATYTAEYSSVVNSYTITWIVDGTTTTTSVAYGTVPTFSGSTAKSATAQYTYTFDGWDTTPVAVTGTATYTAEYSSTVNSYTITWIVDGVTTTSTVEYGSMPSYSGSTDKAGTAQYTYTFDGWDNDPVAVTGAATYTAEYSSVVNQYTVTFYIGDTVYAYYICEYGTELAELLDNDSYTTGYEGDF